MTRNFHKHVFSLSFTLIVLAGVAARAGEPFGPAQSGYEFNSSASFHSPVPPLPVELGFTQSHSSTAAEGYLRGKAAVIQAVGNFHLAESQSAILFEQARSLDRDNDLRQTQALHFQQVLWREAREEKRAYRDEQIAAGRERVAERRATVLRAAYLLTPAEVNFATGEINWPAALSSDEFQADRERMNDLFRELARYGLGQPGVAAEVERASKSLSRTLRDNIGLLSRDEYLAAQKFLLGLTHAASDVQG